MSSRRVGAWTAAAVVAGIVGGAQAGQSGFLPVAQATQPGKPDRVFVADMDGDEVPDLITSDVRTNVVVVRRGDGAGGFAAAQEFRPQRNVLETVVLDADGDGDQDIVVTHDGSLAPGNTAFPDLLTTDGLTLLRNDGTGVLTPELLPVMGRGTARVFALDLDADGDTDLLLATGHGDSVLLNDGAGGFGNPAWLSQTRPYRTCAVADFDGDGDAEALRVAYDGTYLAEFDGAAGVASDTRLPGVAGSTRSVVADLDADGDEDVVSIGASALHVHLNPGDGRFGAPTDVTVPGQQYLVEAGDVDGDGAVDLVTSGGGQGASVFLNDGAGAFSGALVLVHPGATFVAHATVADILGDTQAELLSVDLVSSTVQVFAPSGLAAPAAGTATPAELLAGQTLDVTLSGSGFQSGAVADFGPGVAVLATTFVDATRVDVRVSVAAPLPASAPSGARTVTLTNPDAQTAVFAFAVEAGPQPAVVSLSPARVFAGSTVTFDLRGSAFDAGAAADFGNDVVVTDTVRLAEDRLLVTAQVRAGAATGAREVAVANGTGRPGAGAATLVVDPPLALDLADVRAVLAERRNGRDTLRVDAGYAANVFATGAIADPTSVDVTLRVGDPTAPLELTIAAGDAGWRTLRNGRLAWTSPRGAAGPRWKVVVDPRARTLRAIVRRVDIVLVAGSDVLVDVAFGADRGVAATPPATAGRAAR